MGSKETLYFDDGVEHVLVSVELVRKDDSSESVGEDKALPLLSTLGSRLPHELGVELGSVP